MAFPSTTLTAFSRSLLSNSLMSCILTSKGLAFPIISPSKICSWLFKNISVNSGLIVLVFRCCWFVFYLLFFGGGVFGGEVVCLEGWLCS